VPAGAEDPEGGVKLKPGSTMARECGAPASHQSNALRTHRRQYHRRESPPRSRKLRLANGAAVLPKAVGSVSKAGAFPGPPTRASTTAPRACAYLTVETCTSVANLVQASQADDGPDEYRKLQRPWQYYQWLEDCNINLTHPRKMTLNPASTLLITSDATDVPKTYTPL